MDRTQVPDVPLYVLADPEGHTRSACRWGEQSSPSAGLRGRTARAGEDLVESRGVVLGQRDVDRLDRGVQLLHGARADDRTERARSVQRAERSTWCIW